MRARKSWKTLSIIVLSLSILSACDQGLFDTTPPAAPRGLAALAGDGQALLSWEPVSEQDLAAYRVYLAADEAGQKELRAEVADNATTIEPLAAGATYVFWVTAVDEAGNESLPSDPASAYLPTPDDFDSAVGAGLSSSVITSTVATAYSSSRSQGALLARSSRKAALSGLGAVELYDNDGCPLVTLEGVLGDRVLSIVYGQGCQLSQVAVSGSITGAWTYQSGQGLAMQLSIESLQLGETLSSGEIDISAGLSPEMVEVVVTGTVSTDNNSLLIDALTATVALDLTAQPPADSYAVHGAAAYASADDRSYYVTLEEVTAEFQCLFPSAGTILVESANPPYAATLDFGSGACDTLITVTIGALTKEIDLAEWTDKG